MRMLPSRLTFKFGFDRFFTSERYFCSLLVILTYGLLRKRNIHMQLNESVPFLEHVNDYPGWERMSLLLCAISGGIRFWKSRSLDEGMSHLLLYAQGFVLVMALVSDRTALLLYVIAFALIYLLFPAPCVDWSGSRSVASVSIPDMTPNQFREQVLGAGASSDVTYVVIFYAGWHANCCALAPMYLDLASRYSAEKLQFVKLDVGHLPQFTGSVGIELSTFSKQLPTAVLYEKGEEVLRVPKKSGGKVYGAGLGAREIAKAFELDMRFAQHSDKVTQKAKPDAPAAPAGDGSGSSEPKKEK